MMRGFLIALPHRVWRHTGTTLQNYQKGTSGTSQQQTKPNPQSMGAGKFNRLNLDMSSGETACLKFEALYVPSFDVRLYSVQQSQTIGHPSFFEFDPYIHINRAHRFPIPLSDKSRLYTFKHNIHSAFVTIAPEIVHQRIGHAHAQAINHLYKSKNVVGLERSIPHDFDWEVKAFSREHKCGSSSWEERRLTFVDHSLVSPRQVHLRCCVCWLFFSFQTSVLYVAQERDSRRTQAFRCWGSCCWCPDGAVSDRPGHRVRWWSVPKCLQGCVYTIPPRRPTARTKMVFQKEPCKRWKEVPWPWC